MERIKQAIEDANHPRTEHLRRKGNERVISHPSASSQSFQISIPWNTVKYVTAAIFIFIAGWMWLRLDFMNEIELITSQFINDSIKTSRAEMKRRSQDEEKYRQMLQASLTHCLEVAEQDKEKYIKVVAEQVKLKNAKLDQEKARKEKNGNHEKFIIPDSALAQADSLMQTAKADCQQIYLANLNK